GRWRRSLAWERRCCRRSCFSRCLRSSSACWSVLSGAVLLSTMSSSPFLLVVYGGGIQTRPAHDRGTETGEHFSHEHYDRATDTTKYSAGCNHAYQHVVDGGGFQNNVDDSSPETDNSEQGNECGNDPDDKYGGVNESLSKHRIHRGTLLTFL